MSRFRNYCYTLNNYTVGDSASLSDNEAVYHVWGYERSASGTPHVQGFIQFETPKALTAVNDEFGRTIDQLNSDLERLKVERRGMNPNAIVNFNLGKSSDE